MIANRNHKKMMAVVDKKFLENYNSNMYEFGEVELVLCIPNITESDITPYIELYSEGKQDITNYIKLKILLDYFDCSNKQYILNRNMNLLISNMPDTNYWMNPYFCKLNLTEAFMNRGFALNITKTDNKEISSVLNKLNNFKIEDNNYLEHIHRKQVYIDASNAIKNDKYILYRIGESDNISFEEINELFDNIDNDDEHTKYKLFCSLLISKKYCHLVINNSHILTLMQPIITKFLPLFKYLWGYAWVTCYLEECIKKTRTTVNDRYVFTIDTANKLPVFPYCSDDIHMNPYNTLLVSSDIINFNKNLQGIGCIAGNKSYGVCTLDEFKQKLHIFTSYDKKIDLFDNLNWNNIAISGSIITACVPKYNPLLNKFANSNINEMQRYHLYYEEYYPTSDIDMMCNHKSIFDFIDKVYEVYECIKTNVQAMYNVNGNTVKLVPYKKISILVGLDFIRDHMQNYTVDYVMKNKNTPEIKQIFYKEYVKQKNMSNAVEKQEHSNIIYDEYYNYTSIDDLSIIIIEELKHYENTSNTGNNYITSRNYPSKVAVDMVVAVDMEDEMGKLVEEKEKEEKEEKIYFKICESIKYKIESKHMEHNIEIFQIKYQDFFSTVSKFHLPCVRGFYDGNQVYLLPSAITAFMTMLNIDYKYFAGSKDPIEILNKNRCRGFGTCINDKEKIHLIEYSRNIKQWQNLYNIAIKNKKSIDSVFGSLRMENKLFEPRKYNHHLHLSSLPSYNINNYSYINTVEQLKQEYSISYNYTDTKYGINILEFKTINNAGYITPLKTWIIDAVYDMYNQNNSK
jgi:hypothetical protein